MCDKVGCYLRKLSSGVTLKVRSVVNVFLAQLVRTRLSRAGFERGIQLSFLPSTPFADLLTSTFHSLQLVQTTQFSYNAPPTSRIQIEGGFWLIWMISNWSTRHKIIHSLVLTLRERVTEPFPSLPLNCGINLLRASPRLASLPLFKSLKNSLSCLRFIYIKN